MGHGPQGGSGINLLELQSRRLKARRWQDLTAASLEALFAPNVVRWLPGGFRGLADDASRRSFLNMLSAEAEIVALFAEDEGIGLLILSHSGPGCRERNMGYLLVQHAWGRGIASELLLAVQDLYRGSGVVLSGGVMEKNAASARVLEKAGFKGDREGAAAVYRWDSAI